MSGADGRAPLRAALLALLLTACSGPPPAAEPASGGSGVSVNVGGSLRAYYGNVSR